MRTRSLLVALLLAASACSDDTTSSKTDIGSALDQRVRDGGGAYDDALPADAPRSEGSSPPDVADVDHGALADGGAAEAHIDSASAQDSVADTAVNDFSVDHSAADISVDQTRSDTTVDTLARSSWLDNTLDDFPATMTALGLFPHPAERSRVDRRVRYYEPRYPLWTDGSDKGRWVFVPTGQTIDNSARAWVFPDGTALFKHFGFPGQPVETRVLRRRNNNWEYAVYQWNSAGDEATLLPGNTPVAVTIAGQPQLDYHIPSLAQCAECHDSNMQRVGTNDVRVPVIGFDELRLNHTLAGASQTQLAALAAAGLFSQAPPSTPDAIQGSAAAVVAKGWLHGNCAHCHNANLKYDARHAQIESTAIDQPKNFPYIVPQDVEGSRIFVAAVRWNNTLNVSQMPRVGVSTPDPQAEALLTAWINSLPLP